MNQANTRYFDTLPLPLPLPWCALFCLWAWYPTQHTVMTDEKRYARSQKFNISDQMWSIQVEEQGLQPGDIFCGDPDRADPEPMVSNRVYVRFYDGNLCCCGGGLVTFDGLSDGAEPPDPCLTCAGVHSALMRARIVKTCMFSHYFSSFSCWKKIRKSGLVGWADGGAPWATEHTGLVIVGG